MDQFLPCIQRVVLLIDLHPLFSSQDPNRCSYLTQILSSIRQILSAPQLGSSLSALKFFFSSLSPVLSSSKTDRLIGRCSDSLSFNHHSQTLSSLQETLNSVSSCPDQGNERINGAPNASMLAKSLLQLEQYVCDRIPSDGIEQDLVGFRSNLVILFSPVSQDSNFLAQFVDQEVGGDKLVSFDDFSKKFSQFFCPVKERLDSKYIHLSWVGVDFEFGSEKETINSGWIERVFKEHNWGFSSTDRIILGSSIVPIGLIFPYIGSSIGCKIGKNSKKSQIDLILEISDVRGNPLECKSCELELLDLKIQNQRSVQINPTFHNWIQEISKIQAKGVIKTVDISKLIQNSLSLLLIHGFPSELIEKSEGSAKESFFLDKILEFLCSEKGEFLPRKPTWQIFLSFLYSTNYSALVLIPDISGTFFEGILIPFTINHALIYVLKNGSFGTIESKIEKERRKKGIIENLIQTKDLNSFREIVLSKSESGVLAELRDFYLRNLTNKQKKLKFLKCWMNQVREVCPVNCDESGPERENKIISEKEKEREIQVVKIEENEMDSPFACMEEIEEFISNLEEKIESGLIAEVCNLGILAESLVQTLMEAIRQKNGDKNVEGVPFEVSNLLFKKPKDLIAKYKDSSFNTNYKIKEHELQILFRMEILKSESGSKIEENLKQKMVKEVCAFLEFIDINLQMDSSYFATSLLDFAEKSLKSRYNDSLPAIIQKIYTQMEFDFSEKDSAFYSSNNSDPDNSTSTSNPARQPFDGMLQSEIIKAQKTRERNRRLSFITSWVPDLKRVWALKQPKLERFVPDLRGKRKKRRLSSSIVVSETPMTGTKESFGTSTGTKENSVCRSLSKALFCDESELGQDSFP